MVCQSGHSEWISTTNGACFATRSGLFESCFCPISTCGRGADGHYGCQFTYLSYFIIYALLAALAGLSIAYYRYNKRVAAALQRKLPQIIDWKNVNDAMFGVYRADTEAAEEAAAGGVRSSGGNGKSNGKSGGEEMAPVRGGEATATGERAGLLCGGASGYGATGLKA